jgi:uncharacterized protein with HEPN domain
MYDEGLVVDILQNLYFSMGQIQKRFNAIKSADDFVRNDIGLEKLDSICMQLIAIGEALKQLDKITQGELFSKYPQIDWKKAMGMRDIIAHHYFDIDHETVYVVCSEYIPDMNSAVGRMLGDLR